MVGRASFLGSLMKKVLMFTFAALGIFVLWLLLVSMVQLLLTGAGLFFWGLYTAAALVIIRILWIQCTETGWRRLGPNPFLDTGILLNTIVVSLNGGRMPVLDYTPPINGLHAMLTAQTAAPYLSDVINIGIAIFSIGDLMIFSGLLCLVFGFQKNYFEAGKLPAVGR